MPSPATKHFRNLAIPLLVAIVTGVLLFADFRTPEPPPLLGQDNFRREIFDFRVALAPITPFPESPAPVAVAAVPVVPPAPPQREVASVSAAETKAAAEPKEIVLKSPRPDQVFRSEGSKARLGFEWEAPVENGTLEISTDPEFGKIAKALATHGRTEITNITLAPGTYYWRVRTQGAGAVVSASREFVIKQSEVKKPVVIVAPPAPALRAARPAPAPRQTEAREPAAAPPPPESPATASPPQAPPQQQDPGSGGDDQSSGGFF